MSGLRWNLLCANRVLYGAHFARGLEPPFRFTFCIFYFWLVLLKRG